MITGNKGEWSEIYTLLKLISDKKIFAGDAKLNKIEDIVYPIISILRDNKNSTHKYSYDSDIVIIDDKKEIVRIPICEFSKQAKFLLEKLKEKTKGTFAIPSIESFINSFHCTSLKAKSTKKSDITIVVHDVKAGINPTLGFSIKSQLGGASTLLNAGKTTNFIYEVSHLDITEIDKINSIETRSKIKDRILSIINNGGKFNFVGLENSVFYNNLLLIDSALPNILSELLYTFYSSSSTRLNDLLLCINNANPLEFDLQNGHPFYDYKIKRFLSDIALGMTPSSVWSGQLDATGGFLVVKEDGDILCYHIYNRNEFENYLVNNTKLETASSNRHNFGLLYEEKNKLFFKLNLQIRFH